MEIADGAWITATCSWLKQSTSDIASESLSLAISEARDSELETFLNVLVAEFDELNKSGRRLRILMQLVASRLIALREIETGSIAPETLVQAYDRLSEVDAQAAAHILQILAAQGVAADGDEESIDSLAGILVDSPPNDWQWVALGISPLWKANAEQLELFFDRLHDGFVHPTTLAVLLDLANFSVRKRILNQHPWENKRNELSSLLSAVIAQLEKLEKEPKKFGPSVEEVQRILADSVALTISLCDALGQIGDPQSIPVLSTALDLSHRRIQTEAAGALARLGDALGHRRIIELANDSVARQRAVAYAEELGFAEEIDESLRYPVALAESALAAWLAAPPQFGFPPTSLEHIDSRTLFWPSFEEPQDCFLFRFSYELPIGTISNIGMSGPVTHAFQADLANLPIDDIYAAFAGWQAEHEEIFEVPLALLNQAQRREADAFIAHFEDLGFEVTEGIALTFFLGEMALLAKLTQDGRQLCGITDGSESLRYPVTNSPTSISPEVVLSIYRGRKLLRSFNSEV
jgi:hypothetical protein